MLTVAELIKLRNADLNVQMSRVGMAFNLVSLMRQSAFVHSGIDGVGPSERKMSQFELGAYNQSLETLRLWISGESFGVQVDDDDLPGPDLAVKLPPMIEPPDTSAPAPAMVSVGQLCTSR